MCYASTLNFILGAINPKSLKVIKQRSTRSEKDKRQGGWEGDGGHVEIIRHRGPNGFSWRIPLLAETALVSGELLLWALDLGVRGPELKKKTVLPSNIVTPTSEVKSCLLGKEEKNKHAHRSWLCRSLLGISGKPHDFRESLSAQL